MSWKDTIKKEEVTKSKSSWRDTVQDEVLEPSQLEAGLRGAGQGVTMEFLDEIIAAGKAIPEDVMEAFSSDTSGVQPVRDEQGRITNLDKFPKGNYEKYRDEQRAQDKAAKEAHPWTYGLSEVAGGMAPAVLTGGGTAVAGIGKELIKESTKGALKAAVKKGALLGAGQGAVSGVGYSNEEDLSGIAKDALIGGTIGAGAGAVLPVVGKAIKPIADATLEKVKPIADLVKSIPIVGDTIESYNLSAKGKGVLGEKAHLGIIEESKDLVKDKLLPLLVSESEKSGKTIGKIIKRIDSLDVKTNISKELNSVEKQVANLIDTGKVPTEEGQTVLKELLGSINKLKKKSIVADPTKNVEAALSNLEKQKNKIIKVGEEVGESFSFTEPKVDLDTGIITMVETRTGKVLSSNIKPGENIQQTYKDLTAEQLRGLKTSAYDVLKKAKTQGQGIAKKPIARTWDIANEALAEAADKVNLRESLNVANKRFAQTRMVDELLPQNLLGETSRENINKVAQFLRKSDIEGISGDDLRDKLIDFSKTLREFDPKFAEKLLSQSDEIAKRYNLSNLSRQSFGLNLGTGKSLGIMAGGIVGSTKKFASDTVKKIASPVTKTISNISKLPSESLNKMATQYSKSSNSGVKYYGDQLLKAMTQEGQARDQAIWSLSQSPAFRELVKRGLPDMDSKLFDTTGLEDPNQDELGPTEVSNEYKDGGVVEAPSKEDIKEVEAAIDSVNRQQSSGDDVPVYQLDDLLGKINNLKLSENQKGELETKAIHMIGFSDGNNLKELLRKIDGLR